MVTGLMLIIQVKATARLALTQQYAQELAKDSLRASELFSSRISKAQFAMMKKVLEREDDIFKPVIYWGGHGQTSLSFFGELYVSYVKPLQVTTGDVVNTELPKVFALQDELSELAKSCGFELSFNNTYEPAIVQAGSESLRARSV